jgi:hypothetical protein
VASERAQRDQERNRRLLFWDELADGRVRPSQLARAAVRQAATPQRVPSRISRRYQRRLMARGALRYEAQTVARQMAARRAVLGEGAEGPPRILLRAGAFPHPLADEDPSRFGIEPFRRAHATLAEAGVPYLLAVAPRVCARPLDRRDERWRPLDDGELEILADLRHEGVAFAAHGLDQRTRRRGGAASELHGLSPKQLGAHLDLAAAELAEVAIRPDVFVPPFDRFDWRQWDTIAARYEVVTAGHDSVDELGYHDGPLWRGDAVWLPVYRPLEGPAADVLAAVRALADAGASVWAGAAIDWSSEIAGSSLAALLAGAGTWLVDWERFVQAVRGSAGDVAPTSAP